MFSGSGGELDLTKLAIPAFTVTMAIEVLALRRRPTVDPRADLGPQVSNVERPTGYELKDTLASLAMGSGMLAIGLASERFLAPLHARLGHSLPARAARLGNRRGAVIGALVAWDFLYYWQHRWGHEVRLLWASHVNHHSSERYNLSTALRQTWTGALTDWVHWPMFLLGYTPGQVARAGQLNLLYQYWVHTEIVDRMPGWFEHLFNTPSHHRVHHGSNREYLDRNYGGIAILWDRLFGTFTPEGERISYGLTTNIDSFNPMTIAFHEYAAIWRDVRSAASVREALGYVVGPPGWAPSVSSFGSLPANPLRAGA